MISNLERGNKSIKIENLLKLCEILNVSTDYILKGELIDSDKEEAFTKLLKLNKQDYKMIEMLIDFCINKENDGSE